MTLALPLGEKDSITRICWLYLLASGGWHRAYEVRDALLLEEDQVVHALSTAAARGMVERRRVRRVVKGSNTTSEYRVTKKCLVPRSVPLEALLKALDGQGPTPRFDETDSAKLRLAVQVEPEAFAEA